MLLQIRDTLKTGDGGAPNRMNLVCFGRDKPKGNIDMGQGVNPDVTEVPLRAASAEQIP